jgi:TolA-binding protein
MKKTVVALSLVFSPLALITQEGQGSMVSAQEGYFLRRIVEFWKDKDYALVKEQVHAFLKEHPTSAVADNLYAILGDLHYQEENYTDATLAYAKITGDEFREKTLYRYVHSLYELKRFNELINVSTPFFADGKKPQTEFCDETEFLLAESLFQNMLQESDESTKVALAERAKPLYQALASGPFRSHALSPLVEIHRTLKEYPQASTLYITLAHELPDQAEDLLFQAASLQLSFDPGLAIKTYEQIVALGGPRSSESAFNELVLLFQANRFADLIESAKTIEAKLASEHHPLFLFCLGRSYFAQNNYDLAATTLQAYVNEESVNEERKKSAYLTLIACAQESHNLALFDTVLENFLSAFPKDQEAAKALLLHAQELAKNENLSEASKDFSRLIDTFPDFEQKEGAMLDHALLLSKAKDWGQSRTNFLTLLHQFPESSHADLIWTYILNCSAEELKEASAETMVEKKKQFVSDLRRCLIRPSLFQDEERANYEFLLGKTLFEIDEFSEATAVLEDHLVRYPNHITSGESHLILALASKTPELFVTHAEEALGRDANIRDRGGLHLQLYNAYLQLGQVDKAADHLYVGYINENNPIQDENRLWLANHFYTVKDKDRASVIFKKILGIGESDFKLSFSPDTSFLEVEALKFAELLDPSAKSTLLASLVELQTQNPGAGWKFVRQAQFELGKAYEEAQESSLALKTYEDLISASGTSSYYSVAALLQKSRLQYSLCGTEQLSEANPAISQILSSLKDLQIQKKVSTEPLHLEAALDYADIRTTLSPDSALFYLNRVKEDYAGENVAADYSDALAHSHEKQTLVQSYMKCIEAEMLCLEDSAQSRVVAKALFDEIKEKGPITPYLEKRIDKNLRLINQ